MDMLQLDVARQMHYDRERMVAEAYRAAHWTPAPSAAPTHAPVAVVALGLIARLSGHRAHVAR